MIIDFEKLQRVAVSASMEAGHIIMTHFEKNIEVTTKQGLSSYAAQVVTEVDKACEEVILKRLRPISVDFDLAILSEETEDDGSRFIKPYFWCIDPMDGTLAFIEKRSGFSVSIALVRRDGVPVIGVVYDPVSKTVYTAQKGKGAHKNEVPIVLGKRNEFLTYVCDKKLKNRELPVHDLEELRTVQNKLQLDSFTVLSGGGSVINAIKVLEHPPALMFKFPKKEKGGGSLWDYAATACIFNELGLRASDFKGHPLDLNKKEDLFMNHTGIWFSNV